MYSFTLRVAPAGGRFASIFLLCIAISSSPASGWWPSPETAADAPPQSEPVDKPKTVAPPTQDPKSADKPKTLDKSKAGEKLQPKIQPNLKPDRKGKGKGSAVSAAGQKKRKSKRKFEMNPNAKWACDQQTATLKPVWRGEKTLTFPFSIRNDGTADLRIRAKGG